MEPKQPKKEIWQQEENAEDEELRKQYHPAFCEAMTEELEANLNQIECMKEYNLNSMPNRIDLLIVKKLADTEMESGLGKLFRQYNLVEYRSPGQTLDAEVYYRSMGYAYLYTAYQADVASVEEVTLSFVREGKPVRLMAQFLEWGFEITQYEAGIYHIKKNVMESFGMTVEKAMESLKIPQGERTIYAGLIKHQQWFDVMKIMPLLF